MTRVRLELVAFDAGTQVRAGIDEPTVALYAERMTVGDQFPPVVVFHDGSSYYLADGFHRVMAAQRIQWREIDADVRPGTKEDALWFALAANRTNGKPMTVADKKHAIVQALRAWPEKSANAIAAQIGVSQDYVSQTRAEVKATFNLPDRVIGSDGVSYPATKPTPAVVVERRQRRRDRIADALRAGVPSQQIVKEMKVDKGEVGSIRRSLGLGRDQTREGVAQRRKDIRDMAERGFTSRQISAAVGVRIEQVSAVAKAEGIVIHADRVVGKARVHDANRIVAAMVEQATNLTADVDLIDFSQLDPSQLSVWLESLNASRKSLSAFIRRLEQEQKKYGQAAQSSPIQDSAGAPRKDADSSGARHPARVS
jgi:ParB-like nuclease family protein